MPLTGPFVELQALIKRLEKLPDFRPEVLRDAVPTVKVLLSHATGSEQAKRPKLQQGPVLPGGAFRSAAQRQGPIMASGRFTSGTVPPAAQGYPSRRYVVSPLVQGRIDALTHVEATDSTIRVTATGSEHLRPIVPVGEMPLKWRAALYARIRGSIRRHLRPHGGDG